ncbi:type II toxin-antitoxin system HicA family toxin [Nostoc flagelliforme]|uniref:type II toxin-antitoxin system HicA family toxin n=1 Tax=Nostoc flagelliforme TaxID=1306274 RepID=UPI002410EBCB|nr:type II toxin-antitoxin system HicA family toxin [Nostoc flagelliforme]
MKAVSGKALCKILERQGWELKRITGSHHIYVKESVDVIPPFRFIVIETYRLEL